MKRPKIYLCHVERFWDNNNSFSGKTMQDVFNVVASNISDEIADVELVLSGSTLSSPKAKVEAEMRKIEASDICIIDVTRGPKSNIAPTMDIMVNIHLCAKYDNKKIIFIYNEDYKPDMGVLSDIKPDNILGIYSHNGTNFSKTQIKEIADKISEYLGQFEEYKKETTVIMDNEKPFNDIFFTWVNEKKLRGNGYFHINILNNQIVINYEEYNSFPICSLNINTSNLDPKSLEKLSSDIYNLADLRKENIFVHLREQEQSVNKK